MNLTKFKLVAILGALAIGAIIAAHAYWVYQMWQYQERNFSQKVNMTLYRVANDLVDISGAVLPSSGLIKQVSPNYFVVNINNHIQFDHLEYYLKKEFQNSSISEDFEYGIYDCSNDQMVYGNYINNNYMLGLIPEKQSVLPTHESFTYYFGVLFPHKNVGLISNMKMALMLTLLLLIAVVAYIYAIFTIFRQNQLSEMVKDFINNMTHEFKTPLTSINLASSGLSRNPAIKSDQKLNRFTGIIDTQVKRLTEHVERILDIEKLEKNQYHLNLTKVNINEVIRSLVPATELRLESVNGSLKLDLVENLPEIEADKIHFTNIIENLIDNSIKYSIENPSILISSKFLTKTVVIEIQDKGIGIDFQSQRKVFEKFFRTHTGNIHDVKGFGLGLYYVKNICDGHKWKIKMKSALGQGTAVTIIIPVA